MRTWIVALIMLCVAACGCDENRMTVWGLSGQDTDLIARVGIENDNTEVGAVVKYGVSSEIKLGP